MKIKELNENHPIQSNINRPPIAGLLNGRRLSATTNSNSWNLVKVIIKVVGFAYLLGTAFASPTADMQCLKHSLLDRPQCSPGDYAVANALPPSIRPFSQNVDPHQFPQVVYNHRQHFPEGLERFVYPEVVIVDSGERSCRIQRAETHLILLCEMYTAQIKAQVDQDDNLKKQIYVPISFEEKGYNIDLKDNPEPMNKFTIQLGLNPQKKINFQKAVEFVEERFLQNSQFYAQEDINIVRMIKKLHSIIAKGLKIDDKSIQGGIFRPAHGMVFGNEKSIDLMNLREILKNEIKVTKKELASYDASVKIFQANPKKYPGDVFLLMKPDQQAVWRKLAFIPLPPEHIEKAMFEFAQDWKRYAQLNTHPVALAAWVHQRLGAIHPFNDGNGRLSRLLMNAILMKGGFNPVVIIDDKEYTRALNDEEHHPGSFARYLSEKAIPWSQKKHHWLFPHPEVVVALKPTH